MNKIMTIIALSFFALIGCGNKPNTEDEIDLTNVISMSYQNVLKKTTSAVTCIEDPAINDITDPNFINLGCFFKSGNYYFILNNNSEYVVTNLKISSSNDAFEVTPDSMTALGVPGKTAGVTPIIRISVNHWSSLNNESNSEALPRGINTSIITISGTVNDEQFVNSYTIGGTAKTFEAIYDDSTNKCIVDGPMLIDGVYNENYMVNFDGFNAKFSEWNCRTNWKSLVPGVDIEFPSVFGQSIANGNDITKYDFSIVLSK